MKNIYLTNGGEALIDDEEFEFLNNWKWYKNAQGYATRRVYEGSGKSRKAKDVRMHRLIMDEPEGKEVDHIDGNGLNNQKSNLRTVEHRQNTFNRGPQRNNKSGYKGVSWSKSNKKWYVCIALENKTKCLGHFDDVIEAAKVYNQAALKYHGEFARLNKI